MISEWAKKRYVDAGQLNKGLKEAALAGGIAASAISPAVAQQPAAQQQTQQAQQTQQSPLMQRYQSLGSKPEDRFLWNIAQVESSGGEDFSHRQIQSGMHRGHRAIGTWGLMPNTVNEMLNRKKISGQELTPEFKRLRSMDHKTMKAYLEANPHIEIDLARTLARHVINRQKGNASKAAYAWFTGHNQHPKHIGDKHKGHFYTERYHNADSVNPFVVQPDVDMMQKNETLPFKIKFQKWKNKRDKENEERLYSTNESHVYDEDYKPEGDPPPSLKEVAEALGKEL